MGAGSFDKTSYQKRILATDLVHSCSTYGTFPFHRRFTIFHGDFNGFRIFALGAAFYAIHLCHSFIHLLSKKDSLLRQPSGEQNFTYKNNGSDKYGFYQISFYLQVLRGAAGCCMRLWRADVGRRKSEKTRSGLFLRAVYVSRLYYHRRELRSPFASEQLFLFSFFRHTLLRSWA